MPLPHPESPRQRLQAVIEALQQNERMGYTEAAGLLPLRERIVQQYAEAYGVTGLSKERVFVTTGSSGVRCLCGRLHNRVWVRGYRAWQTRPPDKRTQRK